MYEREMKYTEEWQKLPSEESHPVTYPFGEETEERDKTKQNTIIIINTTPY